MRFPASAWQFARSGLGAAVGVATALAWGFAAFVLGHRFVSPLAGELLGLAVISSLIAMEIGDQVRDRRMTALVRGDCPRCSRPITVEHRHRRWSPERSTWLEPETAWDCASCSFSHIESWDCPTCPKRAEGLF